MQKYEKLEKIGEGNTFSFFCSKLWIKLSYSRRLLMYAATNVGTEYQFVNTTNSTHGWKKNLA